ncbi:MAG TPA: ADYC domain-containing protein [Nevskia sp.]|nr:ADYC domain-containing protein [Nevskia sp.]
MSANPARLLKHLLLATALLGLGACASTGPQPAPPPAGAMPPAAGGGRTILAPDLVAERTAFVLRLPDGRVLSGQQLQGAIVHVALEGGRVTAVKLASITPDPQDPDILRHEYQAQDDSGRWAPVCQPNFYGETWGFPLALPEGHPGREGAITLTCASGAVGKCVRFGYKPWARGPHGEDLAPYHAACVRMVRADYCGDGVAHTKNGTSIDLYDHIGVQKDEDRDNDQEFPLEAGWSPQGAVCLARTRWSDIATREEVLKECPRLAQEQSCTEDRAAALGALTFNRSRLKPRIGL